MTIPTTQQNDDPTGHDPASHPALRSGVRTSEFWVTIITGIVFLVGAFVPDDVARKWAAEHGWIGGLVVAVYIAARTYIKATALKVLG